VTNKRYILLGFGCLILMLYLLAPVMQPFYLAAFIAYLSHPVVKKLQKLKIPRILAVISVFFIILLLLVLLGGIFIPLLINQIEQLIQKLPILFDWLQNTAIPWLNSKLGRLTYLNADYVKAAVTEGIKNNQDVLAKIIRAVTTSSFTIIGIIFKLIIIPVVTFYLLRDWDLLIIKIRKLLPKSLEPTAVRLVTEYNDVLQAFLRGQLLVVIILGFIYSIGLWIVKLQFAVLIGLAAGLLSIVPYLGFSVGIITALITAYYQFQSLTALFYVLIVFLIGQSVESLLLTPLLVGDSIGLHPVAVIFAVLAGGYFFGFVGALIALPVAAAIMVLARYGLQKYYHSSLYRQS
jgi:predicted PurR-regulated permease PerM